MTKRLMLLAGCLCLALLTNLSFRVPTTVEAQAQAACQTALAPAFTLGTQKNLPLPGGGVLKDGDLFYLGNANGVQFTTTSPGAVLRTLQQSDFAIPPGYPNTIYGNFESSAVPNSVSSAISCNDSFWDINFVIYGISTANATHTAGDKFELYSRQPNGTGQIKLVEFVTNATGTGATVTQIIPGGDLSAIGHAPAPVGTVLPFDIATTGIRRRTNLITLALPMDGSVPNCYQLELRITKANGTGPGQITLVNLVVTRGNATTATGTGLQTGLTGTYPTALVCPVACPACPPAIVCDTVLCFADACTWCNRLSFPTRYLNHRVVVPGVNFNQPLAVFVGGQINPLIRQYLGCGGFYRTDPRSVLIGQYLAAQLDLQTQLSFWWIKLPKQPLGCHVITPMAMPGMPGAPRALPATFSGGPITSLTDASTLQDLFDVTDWVVTRGTAEDLQKLIAIYKQLNTCRKD